MQEQEEARAFWVTAPGRGEIRGEGLGTPADGDVVVRALYSGISRGTEALVFNGHVPRSEWGRMRAPFQQGEFPAPVKYGYSIVGRVERGPHALTGRTVVGGVVASQNGAFVNRGHPANVSLYRLDTTLD